jgi:hypothetical protein
LIYSKLHAWPNHNKAADLARDFFGKVQHGLGSLALPADCAFTLCHTIGYPANLWVHAFVDSGMRADEMEIFSALREFFAQGECPPYQESRPVRLGRVALDDVASALTARGDVIVVEGPILKRSRVI